MLIDPYEFNKLPLGERLTRYLVSATWDPRCAFPEGTVFVSDHNGMKAIGIHAGERSSNPWRTALVADLKLYGDTLVMHTSEPCRRWITERCRLISEDELQEIMSRGCQGRIW